MDHACYVMDAMLAPFLHRWRAAGYEVIVTADHGQDERGHHGGTGELQQEFAFYYFGDIRDARPGCGAGPAGAGPVDPDADGCAGARQYEGETVLHRIGDFRAKIVPGIRANSALSWRRSHLLHPAKP